MINIKKEILNSYIMAAYIFQFGFLQPIASIFNSQVPIAGFSLLLLIIALINNNFKIKKSVLITFVLLSLYFLSCSILVSDGTISILSIYGEFLLKGISAFYIASIPIKGKYLYDSFLKMALINFIAIFLYPYLSFYDSMNYMRFGYAMVPSVIMFIYATFNTKFRNPLWLIMMIASLLLTIFYGSRGTIAVLIMFTLLIFLFSKIGKVKKIFIVALVSFTIFIIFQKKLLIKIVDYVYFDVGLQTYAIEKIRLMIISGLAESSSGRDLIYSNIIEYIHLNPLKGYGIGFTTILWDTTAHNIFLQILIESGLIGLLIWFILWIYCSYKYYRISQKNEVYMFKVITLILAVAIGRLLVSSDLWLRPEYWFAISMLINFPPNLYGIKRKVGINEKNSPNLNGNHNNC